MKRVLLHAAFWIVYLFQDVLLIFLLNTTRLHEPTAVNLRLSFLNCLVLLVPKLLFTYVILYGTLNKMITEGFWQKGMLLSLLALVPALLLYRGLAVFVADPFVYGWPQTTESFFYPLAFPVALMDIGFVSGAAVALKQIRQQLRRTKAEQQLVKEKLETELKYLRNQTNPHFLFNTLNNIYALARKKSDETAGVVMKLSKLLRFMLYDAAKPLIALSEEIRMLEDYVALEKIRYNDKLTVHFAKEIGDDRQLIAPLLLLPFVENAFKHGASESRFSSFIDITVRLQEAVLTFSVRNTKGNAGRECPGEAIGLSNVKRQLELLYTDYDMQVCNQPSVFAVDLMINLCSYTRDSLPRQQP